MSTRALNLALRLLTVACAGAALGSTTACSSFLFDCPDSWSAFEDLDLGTELDILAVVEGGDFDELVALGAGGLVVHAKDGEPPALSNPSEQALNAVVAVGSRTVVVGDGGTILASTDAGESWTSYDSPTQTELIALAHFAAGDALVAIAAQEVVVEQGEGNWAVVAPPPEGWGELRAVFATSAEVWVVGAAGTAWSASDPSGTWERRELGTEADFIGGGRVSGTHSDTIESGLLIASTQGLWFRPSGADSSWMELSPALDGELVAVRGGYLATQTGAIYDVDEGGVVTLLGEVDFVPRAVSASWAGFVVAGEGGKAIRANEQFCIGGRPWLIDGQLTTAELVGEIPGSKPGALERDLSAAWARDGLYEHASIASFARTARDLMAMGAPGELIRATLAAQGDEIEHARMCFALAASDAGVSLRAGSLPLGHNFGSVSHSRVVEPAAIALAMFDEGCINESLAAATAAVAAASCTSPPARAVLERIARDEARHAALAWRSLRWLLDTHRAQVEPALRQRVARLRLPPPLISSIIDDDAAALADHGRLSNRESTAIMRRVIAEMIRPLATQMLQGIDARSLA